MIEYIICAQHYSRHLYTSHLILSTTPKRTHLLLTSSFDTQVRDSALSETSHLERGRTETGNHVTLTPPALNHHPVLPSAPDAARMGMPSSGLGSWVLGDVTAASYIFLQSEHVSMECSQLANKVAFLSLVMWAGRSCHHWSSFHPLLHFAKGDPNAQRGWANHPSTHSKEQQSWEIATLGPNFQASSQCFVLLFSLTNIHIQHKSCELRLFSVLMRTIAQETAPQTALKNALKTYVILRSTCNQAHISAEGCYQSQGSDISANYCNAFLSMGWCKNLGS